MKKVFLMLCLTAAMCVAGQVQAGSVASTNASTYAGAQNVNGYFTTNLLANVEDSTTLSHVEISRSSGPQAYEYYSFSTLGGMTHLDIDNFDGAWSFDTEIALWDSAGTLLSANDDNGGDFGDDFSSFYYWNSKIHINLASGTYKVGVSSFPSSFGNNGLIFGGQVPTNGTYILNISTNAPGVSAVPEPASMAIFGIGALGMAAIARRKKKRTV